jgi:hypothetical protein
MSDSEDAAERRRRRAEYIDQRVQDMLFNLLMTDFRLTLNEHRHEIDQRNKKLKKGQLADMNRDDDMEAWLEKEAAKAAEATAQHIVNFLREQIVSRDC